MIKKTTEIDAILLNLNKAIDAHYQWLVSMFHSVVARDASKPEITDNHSYGLCQFGRWIDHLGPLDNDELPYVRLMDSAHQHMHNCGRELMLAIVEFRRFSGTVTFFYCVINRLQNLFADDP